MEGKDNVKGDGWRWKRKVEREDKKERRRYIEYRKMVRKNGTDEAERTTVTITTIFISTIFEYSKLIWIINIKQSYSGWTPEITEKLI